MSVCHCHLYKLPCGSETGKLPLTVFHGVHQCICVFPDVLSILSAIVSLPVPCCICGIMQPLCLLYPYIFFVYLIPDVQSLGRDQPCKPVQLCTELVCWRAGSLMRALVSEACASLTGDAEPTSSSSGKASSKRRLRLHVSEYAFQLKRSSHCSQLCCVAASQSVSLIVNKAISRALWLHRSQLLARC